MSCAYCAPKSTTRTGRVCGVVTPQDSSRSGFRPRSLCTAHRHPHNDPHDTARPCPRPGRRAVHPRLLFVPPARRRAGHAAVPARRDVGDEFAARAHRRRHPPRRLPARDVALDAGAVGLRARARRLARRDERLLLRGHLAHPARRRRDHRVPRPAPARGGAVALRARRHLRPPRAHRHGAARRGLLLRRAPRPRRRRAHARGRRVLGTLHPGQQAHWRAHPGPGRARRRAHRRRPGHAAVRVPGRARYRRGPAPHARRGGHERHGVAHPGHARAHCYATPPAPGLFHPHLVRAGVRRAHRMDRAAPRPERAQARRDRAGDQRVGEPDARRPPAAQDDAAGRVEAGSALGG